MIVLYNIIQLSAIILFLPVLVGIVLIKSKYRMRILRRLGMGLKQELVELSQYRTSGRAVVWIHALSVGEVISMLSLIKALRKVVPDCVILVSVATRTGDKIAREKLLPGATYIIPAPLDFLPTIYRYINIISPDLFVLIETDFWPNWIHQLSSRKIPLLLFNGRISDASFASYKRFKVFFLFVFNSFRCLCMQAKHDAENMHQLGVDPYRIKTLGNLKYQGLRISTEKRSNIITRGKLGILDNAEILIAGSTHEGEEEMVLAAYAGLRENLAVHGKKMIVSVLIIAPRNIDRSQEICDLARRFGFSAGRRSYACKATNQVIILDTLGELEECYRLATLAFIGGSLVAEGGHNPLEAAGYGLPILFGPHMEDFGEIAEELTEAGGAKIVEDKEQLSGMFYRLLTDDKTKTTMGNASGLAIEKHGNVLERHVKLIREVLDEQNSGV